MTFFETTRPIADRLLGDSKHSALPVGSWEAHAAIIRVRQALFGPDVDTRPAAVILAERQAERRAQEHSPEPVRTKPKRVRPQDRPVKRCQDCGAEMPGAYAHAKRCRPCGDAHEKQRKRAAKEREKLTRPVPRCQGCGVDLPGRPAHVRWCPPCDIKAAAATRKRHVERKRLQRIAGTA